MFEAEILLGNTERSIRLDTHEGNPVSNVVEPEPGVLERRKYDLLTKRHGAQWINRKRACGVYNCYGMVFASRRTAILEDEQIPKILDDDGYTRINEDETVPGDLVLYRDVKRGLLLHVAVVL